MKMQGLSMAACCAVLVLLISKFCESSESSESWSKPFSAGYSAGYLAGIADLNRQPGSSNNNISNKMKMRQLSLAQPHQMAPPRPGAVSSRAINFSQQGRQASRTAASARGLDSGPRSMGLPDSGARSMELPAPSGGQSMESPAKEAASSSMGSSSASSADGAPSMECLVSVARSMGLPASAARSMGLPGSEARSMDFPASVATLALPANGARSMDLVPVGARASLAARSLPTGNKARKLISSMRGLSALKSAARSLNGNLRFSPSINHRISSARGGRMRRHVSSGECDCQPRSLHAEHKTLSGAQLIKDLKLRAEQAALGLDRGSDPNPDSDLDLGLVTTELDDLSGVGLQTSSKVDGINFENPDGSETTVIETKKSLSPDSKNDQLISSKGSMKQSPPLKVNSSSSVESANPDRVQNMKEAIQNFIVNLNSGNNAASLESSEETLDEGSTTEDDEDLGMDSAEWHLDQTAKANAAEQPASETVELFSEPNEPNQSLAATKTSLVEPVADQQLTTTTIKESIVPVLPIVSSDPIASATISGPQGPTFNSFPTAAANNLQRGPNGVYPPANNQQSSYSGSPAYPGSQSYQAAGSNQLSQKCLKNKAKLSTTVNNVFLSLDKILSSLNQNLKVSYIARDGVLRLVGSLKALLTESSLAVSAGNVAFPNEKMSTIRKEMIKLAKNPIVVSFNLNQSLTGYAKELRRFFKRFVKNCAIATSGAIANPEQSNYSNRQG